MLTASILSSHFTSIDQTLILLMSSANTDAEHQYCILAVASNETFKMQELNLQNISGNNS